MNHNWLWIAMVWLITVLAGWSLGSTDAAWAGGPSVSIDLGSDAPKQTAVVVQILILLTVLSLAPSLLMMMTSFTRIIIVLSFLRTAMGLQQTPPNTVLISLALFLTFFIMAPVFEKAYSDAFVPLMADQIDEVEAFKRAVKPFHDFMLHNTKEHELQLFFDIAKQPPLPEGASVPLQILIPAFMLSEIKRAFEMGFLVFLPFLIPVAQAYNWNLVWLGVIMTINVAIGQFTPPTAVNLMVTCRIAGISMESTIAWCSWLVAAMTAMLLLLTFGGGLQWLRDVGASRLPAGIPRGLGLLVLVVITD